ncbi:hypothetical protein HDU98_009567 [Podochytrium sp. JEL0797]|nr:hypothetical protein HDU98_009567 [Podochytrium sp. JEL0797]
MARCRLLPRIAAIPSLPWSPLRPSLFSTLTPPHPPHPSDQSKQQPRPPLPRSLASSLTITETVHSRKRIFSLSPTKSKLSFKWDDPVVSKSALSKPTPLLATLESAVPHPLKSWFRQTFLPIGFPDSVHPAYTKVHVLQFVETFLWSTVTVLCSQSMLESLGVAAPAATGGAVAIQWVLKDQFGELGKLIFINRFAKSLDSHPKTWFLLFASLGYMLRSIHFSIYNSTHMTFTRNFALQGNVGDIVAKDDSQQTIANLLGLLTGITLLSFNHSPAFLFSCFFLIGPLHYYATIAFLNVTKFEVLSSTKLLLLSDAFVNRAGLVLNYRAIEKEGNTEWFGEVIKKGWAGVKVSKIGGSVKKVFGESGAAEARIALEVMRDEDYLIGYRRDIDSYGIVFHQDVSTNDVMKSIVHVTKLNQRVHQLREQDANAELDFRSVLQETLEWTRKEYPHFAVELEAKGWLTDSVFWGDEGNRCEWERSEREFGVAGK